MLEQDPRGRRIPAGHVQRTASGPGVGHHAHDRPRPPACRPKRPSSVRSRKHMRTEVWPSRSTLEPARSSRWRTTHRSIRTSSMTSIRSRSRTARLQMHMSRARSTRSSRHPRHLPKAPFDRTSRCGSRTASRSPTGRSSSTSTELVRSIFAASFRNPPTSERSVLRRSSARKSSTNTSSSSATDEPPGSGSRGRVPGCFRRPVGGRPHFRRWRSAKVYRSRRFRSHKRSRSSPTTASWSSRVWCPDGSTPKETSTVPPRLGGGA